MPPLNLLDTHPVRSIKREGERGGERTYTQSVHNVVVCISVQQKILPKFVVWLFMFLRPFLLLLLVPLPLVGLLDLEGEDHCILVWQENSDAWK